MGAYNPAFKCDLIGSSLIYDRFKFVLHKKYKETIMMM